MLETYKKNGFALPSAIFLLVVLSILSMAVLHVTSANSNSTINDVLDVKAQFVAKAGADYGAYLASRNGTCPSTATTVEIDEAHLKGFKFSFSCVQNTVNEAGIDQTYYRITSVGCNTLESSCPNSSGKPSNENYVEKSLVIVTARN